MCAAPLCGQDSTTGQNFDHRRGWIETRIRELASVFTTIDVAAYAVMSNHSHVVLRVDSERAAALGNEAVLHRWTQLLTGPLLVQRYLSEARARWGRPNTTRWQSLPRCTAAACMTCRGSCACSTSVFRQANAEDECTGRFWEGRFKSQALLDEQALLTAMAYVDLNPIRAGMAESLQGSEHTSIKARLDDLQGLQFVPVVAPVVTATVADAAMTMITEAAELVRRK